jgi:hypothetical protein
MKSAPRSSSRTALAAFFGWLTAASALGQGVQPLPELMPLPPVAEAGAAFTPDLGSASVSLPLPALPASQRIALLNPADADSPLKPVTAFWLTSHSQINALPSDVDGHAQAASLAAFQEEPSVLSRPLDPEEALQEPVVPEELPAGLVDYARYPPLGFSGPSGVLPREVQQSSDFVPIEDRWRIGFPSWDRYGRGQPPLEDYPYELGRLADPYNQNVLKGDYPIVGQHTFLNITAASFTLNEYRQVPTATTPFESTFNPFSEEFFGDPNQYFLSQNLSLTFDLFHGNASFKPVDWRLRLNPVYNLNLLDTGELGVVYPDVRRGTRRTRHDYSLDQWFYEKKLADLGPDYDFMSVRAGSQPFVSDFRGFVFNDVNRGVRLFGTRFSNRDQFNVVWFDQTEKDTNSGLNTFDDRNQNTTIANYIRQDFFFPGFTGLISFHYNNEQPDFVFDDNGFLVRPDPAGVFRQHEVDAYYIGLGTDGHIGRVNVATQFYEVLGHDSLNPIAGMEQDINAQMAAVELSIDRDWIRFRTSYFFASGDDDPNDMDAEGFDTILDNPNFAGGGFSYWQRQSIKLFGVNLVQRNSLVPDLRSSKIQGQSNFVNPGLQLINYGMDFEVTPKFRVISNANYLWFNHTEVLETFVFQSDVDNEIGADLSLGFEYRPLHSDNIVLVGGYAILIPGRGFDDLFGKIDPFTLLEAQQRDIESQALSAAFLEVALTY